MAPGLAPATLLPCAVAWSASANQTATILGPALGGLLYAAGPAAVYIMASGLFLLTSLFISGIHMERTPPVREPVNLESLPAGIAFIRRRRSWGASPSISSPCCWGAWAPFS